MNRNERIIRNLNRSPRKEREAVAKVVLFLAIAFLWLLFIQAWVDEQELRDDPATKAAPSKRSVKCLYLWKCGGG